ncbi:nucleotide pyrophosphatase/phosphodiesterase family protein [Massilia sp. W12]|uniref:alkaline phosphatase family protein n=1 Tax=Massilia sp. W12 TaxID=3126507 RepID=UPI0030CF1031
MQSLLLLNVVGLTSHVLGEFTPRLRAFAAAGELRTLRGITPAVTCSAQASMLTGLTPQEHGIVGNGWLFRDLAEIWFWRQSNRLMGGEKIWQAGKRRDPAFSCANLFWWYNMASSHDVGATPRPIYKADGRKLPDCLTTPAQWRDQLQAKLGQFPLFQFWGPATSIASSRWIAGAARDAIQRFDPTLSLVYLPHLDYDLQRYGPDLTHPAVQQSLREIDQVAGDLIDAAQSAGRSVMLVSEYGITPVSRVVHLNRHLRAAGWLTLRHEDGAEILDPSSCPVFAVADHQIAHVYVADAARVPEVARLLAQIPGVAGVWSGAARAELGLDHARSGEIVVLAEADAWFSYYYWEDDARAPDFARTVEIHRKPGYDPAELFFDPAIRMPELAAAKKLLLRKLGMRTVMNLIGLDASIVKGSHGRMTSGAHAPVLICDRPDILPQQELGLTDIKALALARIFGA